MRRAEGLRCNRVRGEGRCTREALTELPIARTLHSLWTVDSETNKAFKGSFGVYSLKKHDVFFNLDAQYDQKKAKTLNREGTGQCKLGNSNTVN